MAIYAETRILQSPKSRTQYVTIPARVVEDSQYPFVSNEEVELYVDTEKKLLIIAKKQGGGVSKRQKK